MLMGNRLMPFSDKPVDQFVKVLCVVPDLFSVGEDKWPTELRAFPRVGEYVESDLGRRLRINDIIHKTVDYIPVLELELGKDSVNDVTPTEGGAVAVGMEPE